MAGRCFVILIVFMSILLGKTRAGAEEWDLNRCLELGLKQNPKVIAAENAVRGAKARVVQVQSDYYPDFLLETDYSRFSGTTTASSTSNSISASDRTSESIFFLGLTQNIYDFGRREYKVQASQEDLKIYRWDFKDARLGVIDEIRQAYYGELLAGRTEKVRQQELDRTQVFLRQARGFYQVGLKPKIDVTQAELEVIKSQKALLKSQNDLMVGRVNLQKALGLDLSPDYTLKDDLEAGRVNWHLEELKKEALSAHPFLNRLRTLVQYWEAQVKVAERDFWPRLAGTAKFGRADREIPLLNYSESWNVGVQLTVPLFSGFESRAKLDEFRAALGQAKANYRTKELEILSDLQNQYFNLLLAEKQIQVAEESQLKANENLELAQGRYKAGVGTMLEVTDARVSWIQAENDRIQSLYDYKAARFKLERTLGRDLLIDR